MAGGMTCDFTSSTTVFQSYQNDERVIMKGLCNETAFTFKKISSRAGLELGTARSISMPALNRGSFGRRRLLFTNMLVNLVRLAIFL